MVVQDKYITQFAEGRSLDDILNDIKYLLCLVTLDDEIKTNDSLWRMSHSADYAIEAMQSARKDSN